MNLVVDSGNSAVKVAIFDHQKLMDKLTFPVLEELRSFMQTGTYEHLIISSVKGDESLIKSWGAKAGNQYVLKKDLPLPVRNLYKTPDTLGADRIAAACGAHHLFPETD